MHTTNDWYQLTQLTSNQEFRVEKVRLKSTGISIEGDFELPPLMRLSYEDQIFVAFFIKCHGSIKEMERLFGISYPTVKNRLTYITQTLDVDEYRSGNANSKTLERLNQGQINVDEAIKALEK